jgi:micrococcal nuclease
MVDTKTPAHIVQIFFAVAISLFILPLQGTVLAADFSGPVVSVLDVDTIEVLHNHRPERIGLNGIDCPEIGQAYGHKA